MKNRTNKIILFIVAVITFTIFNTDVKAEKTCKDYTNYYFFSLMTRESEYGENKIAGPHTAYFPLPEIPAKNEITGKSINIEQVCITDAPNVNNQTGCSSTMTVTDYWTRLLEVQSKGEEGTVTIKDGTIRKYKRYITSDDNNLVSSDIWHLQWEKNGEVFSGEARPKGEDSLEIRRGATIASKVSADESTIEEEKRYASINIKRELTTTNGTTPIELIQENGEDFGKGFFDIAVYKVTYTSCTYKAQIDYVYTDGSEAAPSHNEDELEAGYTNKVTSPTIENCTPDKKEVTISIDKDKPKDFYEKVVYTCKIDEEPKNNGPTGDALIYVAWIIGIAALGYSVYYFITLKKSQTK